MLLFDPGLIFDLDSTRMFSAAMFETYFSYLKDISVAAIDYYCMHFKLIVLPPLITMLQLVNFTVS